MPTSEAQRNRVGQIKEEYAVLYGTKAADEIRVTNEAGPMNDLTVLSAPDGRIIVLRIDGFPLADSDNPSVQSDAIIAAVEGVDAVVARCGPYIVKQHPRDDGADVVEVWNRNSRSTEYTLIVEHPGLTPPYVAGEVKAIMSPQLVRAVGLAYERAAILLTR